VNENTVTYLSGADDLAAGAKIYTTSCVACHNAKGEGGVGPNLTDDYWLHGGDIKSIFRTIKYGVDGKGMAAWQSVYSPKELAQVTSYVKSLVGTNPPNGREPQGVIYKEENDAAPDSTQAASASVAGIE
jgi:cytochrome c oxidase cbb3-type subunit 3